MDLERYTIINTALVEAVEDGSIVASDVDEEVLGVIVETAVVDEEVTAVTVSVDVVGEGEVVMVGLEDVVVEVAVEEEVHPLLAEADGATRAPGTEVEGGGTIPDLEQGVEVEEIGAKPTKAGGELPSLRCANSPDADVNSHPLLCKESRPSSEEEEEEV